jgi:hypothetical protein
MDVRELIRRLKTIRCWTLQGSVARNLVDDLIRQLGGVV